MSEERRVAIVGAGPSGLYVAQALGAQKFAGGVDVLEMLPAPYGLVRYGVAPDHARTKSVTRVLQRVMEAPGVRFLGNVHVGGDLSVPRLHAHYDAVVYATGARRDRELGIPGEELAGSVGAAEFVSWYSGHPHAGGPALPADTTTAVVVGAGNVALDVVRILAKRDGELTGTDMPATVLDTLAASKVTDIHLLARRGPADARFSVVELRELGELAGADVVVDPRQLEGIDPERADKPAARANLARLLEWSARPPEGRPRRIHLHFWSRPVALRGAGRVAQAVVETRTGPGAPPERRILDAGFVVRAIGYRSTALPGLPFDPERALVPSAEGRVLDANGAPLPGSYVTGWLKRGPSGVIGTNKSDSAATVKSLLADLPGLPHRAVLDPAALPAELAAASVRVVDWAAWKRLEAHEAALGSERGAPTVKIADTARMLAVCLGG
ncbi:FAD-dependent oxidoreductase [Streptomyces sp. NPDC050560]|uniref:FAD-dependent oxidoreductase n=1 Tax=Streptomyces sp. NPDC050560 TaxID=3365630 RepID=UPI0037935C39